MRAIRATITILLDPRIVGPDAPLHNQVGSVEDEFSAMLSFNPDILDWAYTPIDSITEIEIADPASYDEGSFLADMDR